jgi:hypothetical protein
LQSLDASASEKVGHEHLRRQAFGRRLYAHVLSQPQGSELLRRRQRSQPLLCVEQVVCDLPNRPMEFRKSETYCRLGYFELARQIGSMLAVQQPVAELIPATL